MAQLQFSLMEDMGLHISNVTTFEQAILRAVIVLTGLSCLAYAGYSNATYKLEHDKPFRWTTIIIYTMLICHVTPFAIPNLRPE